MPYGMYDSCTDNSRSGLASPECVLPPLRAPNGFVQYYPGGEPFRNIETYGGVISLNRDDCFYLDATSCGGALASAAESSAKARRRASRQPPLAALALAFGLKGIY